MIIRFRGRLALWVLGVLLLIALVGGLAHAPYVLGGCVGGFKNPATCSGVPDTAGQVNVTFTVAAFSYWVGPWIALSAVLWEAIARMFRKARC